MGSGASFGGGGVGQDRAAERQLAVAMSKAQKEESNAAAQASMAQAKARQQEEMAQERAQKDAIQAAEAAAAVEVDATEVAGTPSVESITEDRPTMQGMSYMQIPEKEEEDPQTDTRGA
tara:strand:+ start:22496 stop:22852 length:357 start_codon:yes stop_codon:yes gene_type:complete